MSEIASTLQAGLEHHRSGRLHEAEAHYRKVLAEQPRNAQAGHLLGLLAFQAGQPELAAQYIRTAIRIDPFHAPFSADLAEVCRSMGQMPEALAAYREALRLNPEMLEALIPLGTLLHSQGQGAEAESCFRRAIKADGRAAEAFRGLGALLLAQGRADEAQAALERAAQLLPNSAEAYFDLAECLRGQGQPHGAIAAYQKAVRLQPALALAHFRCGQSRLALGDYANGWRDFEWRVRCDVRPSRASSLPVWTGVGVSGARLLIHAEDNLGDAVQWVRYVPQLIEYGADVVVDAPAELAALFASSGMGRVVSPEDPLPERDARVSLLSLSGMCETRLETVPAKVPYLSVDSAVAAAWRRMLPPRDHANVGIAWRADEPSLTYAARSIPAAELRPLAEVPGVRLLRLHGASPGDEVAPGADLPHGGGAARLPILDLAAVIANLDLVITGDSLVAHLAGALGVPVWLALEHRADWRWLESRDDSPWYPTMRLFRQSRAGLWREVFQSMAADLVQLGSGR